MDGTKRVTEHHSPREGPAGTARRGESSSGPAPVSPLSPEFARTPLAPAPQTDRLQYLDVATRRIARGMDLDETLRELRWAAVPDFADAIIIHLDDPLPVGDEQSAAPVVLQLHSIDRAPEARTALLMPHAKYASVTERVQPTLTGRLAELLLAGQPAFGDTPGIGPAVTELLGPAASAPGGCRRATG